MNGIDLKKEIIEIAKRTGSRDWCPGTSGNISAYDPDGSMVYIKASGRSMSEISENDILTLDLEGNILEGEGKPSKEVNFHLGIYKARKDAKGVLHTHPPYATAFATAREEFPLVAATAKIILRKIPSVCYYPPGSTELASGVVECFKDETVNVAICEAHGIVAIGKDLHQAYYINDWVEDAAKLAFLTRVLKKNKL